MSILSAQKSVNALFVAMAVVGVLSFNIVGGLAGLAYFFESNYNYRSAFVNLTIVSVVLFILVFISGMVYWPTDKERKEREEVRASMVAQTVGWAMFMCGLAFLLIIVPASSMTAGSMGIGYVKINDILLQERNLSIEERAQIGEGDSFTVSVHFPGSYEISFRPYEGRLGPYHFGIKCNDLNGLAAETPEVVNINSYLYTGSEAQVTSRRLPRCVRMKIKGKLLFFLPVDEDAGIVRFEDLPELHTKK